jgi:hypothetical protein
LLINWNFIDLSQREFLKREIRLEFFSSENKTQKSYPIKKLKIKIMKNKILTFATIIAISFSFSCAKKNDEINTNSGDALSKLPSWVIDPSVPNGIGAVGISSPSKGGLKAQIAIAEINARANIATAIQSEISRVTKSSLRSAKVNENDDVEEFFSDATKEVVKNIPLSGVKRTKMFQAEDGSLYIQMVLGSEDYSKFLNNGLKTFEARAAKSNLGRDNINKTQAASKEIFEELEKERTEKPKDTIEVKTKEISEEKAKTN